MTSVNDIVRRAIGFFADRGGILVLFSLALILFVGFALGGVLQKLKLPPLLGMMVTGVVLGPHVLNLIAPSILGISADLREIALIVILIRAGLALNLDDLKKVGRPAILMCFVPATCEFLAVTAFGPMLLGITRLDAAVLGAVLAAVSPAVVIPRMLRLMEEGYGVRKSIPQLIMAGASVDDIYVVVLFTSLIGMEQGQGFQLPGLARVPVSIVTGLTIGIISGLVMVWLFKRIHMRDTVKIFLLFGLSFLMVSLETAVEDSVPVSGLLAVMALGGTILQRYGILAKRLSGKYEKIWVGAELILFVMVGAEVDIGYIGAAGLPALALIFLALLFRMMGVCICLIRTGLSPRERIFSALAYLPKATVQAAIGGIPLSMGLAVGNTILAVAVLAIVITAPLGAVCIDLTAHRLLKREEKP